MSNLLINHNGQLITDSNYPNYLVNNFSQTGTTTDWTLGGSLTGGVAVLTGTAPNITSITFTVNPTDIICFEFTVSVPTPSTTTSGPGIYIGTRYGQSVYVHTFSLSAETWSQNTSTTTNPYFLNSYNYTSVLTLKNYILGSSVSLSDVPDGETNFLSYAPRAIQLTGSDTTTYIRSGYNSNTSMVIHFSNPRIYNITQKGFQEYDTTTNARFGGNWVNANQFYEF